jgi:hypothetical protein
MIYPVKQKVKEENLNHRHYRLDYHIAANS